MAYGQATTKNVVRNFLFSRRTSGTLKISRRANKLESHFLLPSHLWPKGSTPWNSLWISLAWKLPRQDLFRYLTLLLKHHRKSENAPIGPSNRMHSAGSTGGCAAVDAPR